ncbi:hypothetical protein E4U55_006298 [Claviceps digitariae]|nr:hypothetical protein E4U55_006298 [Claviceps digitariae]
MRFTSIATLLAGAVSCVSAAPAKAEDNVLQRRFDDSGVKDGYYYSSWSSYSGAKYSHGDKGAFDLVWEDGGDVIAGKGYKPPPESLTISYNGTWDIEGNSYLAIYGWSVDPLIEFYIVENYGIYMPGAAGKQVGTLKADGSVYDIYVTKRVNAPSYIGGNRNFNQYWSVRRDKRVGGTVHAAEHIKAWKSLKLPFGDPQFLIVAVEGFYSKGEASIVVE